jgi:hypothetical protein
MHREGEITELKARIKAAEREGKLAEALQGMEELKNLERERHG